MQDLKSLQSSSSQSSRNDFLLFSFSSFIRRLVGLDVKTSHESNEKKEKRVEILISYTKLRFSFSGFFLLFFRFVI